jgi:hypothetical protein
VMGIVLLPAVVERPSPVRAYQSALLSLCHLAEQLRPIGGPCSCTKGSARTKPRATSAPHAVPYTP